MSATGSSPDFSGEPHLGRYKRVLLPCVVGRSCEIHGRGMALFKGRPNMPMSLLAGCATHSHMRGSPGQHHGAANLQAAQQATREAGRKEGICRGAA